MIEEPRTQNERILNDRFPGLLRKLAEIPEPAYTLSLERGEKGDATLRANGLWVHSRFDPRKEAERLTEAANREGPAVILGFGLGYVAEAAAAANPERAIIIAEKDPRILRLRV